MKRTIIALAVGALVFTGCAYKPSTLESTSSTEPSVSATEPSYDVEGSVITAEGKFVKYAQDGLVVTFKSLVDITAKAVKESPGNFIGEYAHDEFDSSKYRYLRATVTVHNSGTAAVNVESTYGIFTCYQSANRLEVESMPGVMSSKLFVSEPEPQRLLPGTSFDFFNTCAYPVEIVSQQVPIALELNVDKFPSEGGRTPYTFVDVEKALA